MQQGSGQRNEVRRTTFASGEGYTPTYLANKHRITVQQARDLLAEVGPDRERLNLVASKVRIASEG